MSAKTIGSGLTPEQHQQLIELVKLERDFDVPCRDCSFNSDNDCPLRTIVLLGIRAKRESIIMGGGE